MCDGIADKLHKKQIEVEALKRELLNKLCTLTLYTGSEARTQMRKRPSLDTCSGQSRKQRRIDSTCVPIQLFSQVPPQSVAQVVPPQTVAQVVPPQSVAQVVPPQTVAQVVPPQSVAQVVPPQSVAQVVPPQSVAQVVPPQTVAQVVPPQSVSRVSTIPRNLSAMTPNSSHQMDTDDSPEVAVN